MQDRFNLLSPRQREVALLLIDGLTNTQVATRLGTTVHTVKAHRAEVMRRMQVASFAELVGRLRQRRVEGAVSGKSGPCRIIIVEDDDWYRDYLTDNLNARGFEAIGVADGESFDLAWSASPAEMVVLDIELGKNKEDGVAIASRLLQSSSCGVIMVTARGKLEDRLAGLSVGVDAYYSKPVNINELVLTMTNLKRRLR